MAQANPFLNALVEETERVHNTNAVIKLFEAAQSVLVDYSLEVTSSRIYAEKVTGKVKINWTVQESCYEEVMEFVVDEIDLKHILDYDRTAVEHEKVSAIARAFIKNGFQVYLLNNPRNFSETLLRVVLVQNVHQGLWATLTCVAGKNKRIV